MTRVQVTIPDNIYDELVAADYKVGTLAAKLIVDYVRDNLHKSNPNLITKQLPFNTQVVLAIKECGLDIEHIIHKKSITAEEVEMVFRYLKSHGVLTSKESICRMIEKIYGI